MTLQYVKRPPFHRRQSFRRGLKVAALLFLIFALWQFGPSLWIQTRLWYWGVECREYNAPTSEWVCEERPSWAGHTPGFLSSAPTPVPLAQFERLAGATSTTPRGPVLYLHERTTPGGVRRLVVVRRVPPAQRQSWDAPVGLEITLWRPRLFLYADVAMTSWLEPDPFPRAFGADQDTVSLRVFAGQTDPSDASRFSISFETVDGPGTLEGKLVDIDVPAAEPRIEWSLK